MNHPEDGRPQNPSAEQTANSKTADAHTSLQQAVSDGTLPSLLEAYVASCRPNTDEGEARPRSRKEAASTERFPNLAGFCRFLGCSVEEWLGMERTDPIRFGRLRAVLEDEALNAMLSATIIGAYLKKRLGYDRESEARFGEQTTVCFEHDIWEDGE